MAFCEVDAGLFANLTCNGSVKLGGVVPFSLSIAISASFFLSKRTKPTPFDRPKPNELAF